MGFAKGVNFNAEAQRTLRTAEDFSRRTPENEISEKIKRLVDSTSCGLWLLTKKSVE